MLDVRSLKRKQRHQSNLTAQKDTQDAFAVGIGTHLYIFTPDSYRRYTAPILILYSQPVSHFSHSRCDRLNTHNNQAGIPRLSSGYPQTIICIADSTYMARWHPASPRPKPSLHIPDNRGINLIFRNHKTMTRFVQAMLVYQSLYWWSTKGALRYKP